MNPFRSKILLTGLALVIQVSAPAQNLDSPYQLKRVRVALMDGTVFNCQILDATIDSLIIQDETRLPLGSKVYIRTRHSDQGITGYVKSISKTHLTLVDLNNTNDRIIARDKIDVINIKSMPFQPGGLTKFQRKPLAASEIAYIKIHKRGSGLLGALAGAAAGAGIMYALSGNSPDAPSSTSNSTSGNFLSGAKIYPEGEKIGPAILGGFVGMAAGAAIGSSNKKHVISGDRGRYEAFVLQLKNPASTRNQPK